MKGKPTRKASCTLPRLPLNFLNAVHDNLTASFRSHSVWTDQQISVETFQFI